MKSLEELHDAELNRAAHDKSARERGHKMVWSLGPNATREGYRYHFVGDCEHCGANIVCDANSSSCRGIRDGREVLCSGPGTHVLTDVETSRANELMKDAIDKFVRAVKRIEDE